MKKQYLDFSKLNFICKEMLFFWGKKKILPSEQIEDTKKKKILTKNNATQTDIKKYDDSIQRIAYNIESLTETKHLPRSIYCSITRMPMQDPVIAGDGHSYERSEIQKWLTKKNTSPITNSYIDDILIPNHTLRAVIIELLM